MNLSTIHRTRTEKQNKEKLKTKYQTYWARRQNLHTCADGPTVLIGDSEVSGKWINFQYALSQKYRGRKIGHNQKTLHSWWKRKIALFISKIDDYVKHIFREDNQEADTRRTWVQKDREQLLWTKEVILKDGRECVVSAMAAPRSTVEVDDRNKWITISKNRRTAESLYIHGSRSGGCPCSYEIQGLGTEKDNQCEYHQAMY